jgi:hypothetical protein
MCQLAIALDADLKAAKDISAIFCTKSISSGAQYVPRRKYFSHSS